VKEERLDLPPSGGMGQAPLVDFCNQNTPRARPLDRPNPDSARLGDCALRARPGGTRPPLQPLVGESLSLRSTPRWNGTSSTTMSSRRTCFFGWCPSLRNGSSRGFTGQGPGGFRPPGALRRDCSRPRLRPDPIRSDTSCRELVATPAGEAAAADTRAEKRGVHHEPAERARLRWTRRMTRLRGVRRRRSPLLDPLAQDPLARVA